MGQPVTLSRTPAAITVPLPEKGEHTADILSAAGFSAAEIDGFRKAGVI